MQVRRRERPERADAGWDGSAMLLRGSMHTHKERDRVTKEGADELEKRRTTSRRDSTGSGSSSATRRGGACSAPPMRSAMCRADGAAPSAPVTASDLHQADPRPVAAPESGRCRAAAHATPREAQRCPSSLTPALALPVRRTVLAGEARTAQRRCATRLRQTLACCAGPLLRCPALRRYGGSTAAGG